MGGTTAATTHELQRQLEAAEDQLHAARESAAWEANRNLGIGQTVWEQTARHPRVKEAQARVAELRPQVEAAQAEVGGVVGRIPNFRVEAIAKKVAAMQRRAAKLGVEAPSLRVTEETETEEITETGPDGGAHVVEVRTWVYVVVSGKAPQLAGWAFLATLQHEQSGTIVRRVPGATREESEAREAAVSLTKYRDAKPICDHCGTIRARKDTYVVYAEETGETKQVGSNCIRDFTGGVSPEAALKRMEWVFAIEDAISEAEDEGFSGGARGREVIETEEFLTHVACMIREHGWVSRSEARYGDRAATADWAIQNLQDRRFRQRDRQGNPLWIDPSESDASDALKALEHARSLDGESDFEHNLKVAVGDQYLDRRSLGIAAAALLIYNRHIEREIERRVEEERRGEALNEHLGEIKERVELTLTVERVFEREGDWGPTFITKMRDAEGRVFTWFGSYEIDRGAIVTGRWTVKDHSEFNGTKETILTRPARDLSWETPKEED